MVSRPAATLLSTETCSINMLRHKADANVDNMYLISVDGSRGLSGGKAAGRHQQPSGGVDAAGCGVATCHEGHGPFLQGQ